MQVVIIIMKYNFAVAASIIGIKNMSPTQTQATTCANILNDLQLVLGLCNSLGCQEKLVKNQQTASNCHDDTYFCCSSINYWNRLSVTHKLKPLGGMQTLPVTFR